MDMIKIVCPLCDAFLAYVKPDTDVYCPKCEKFIYMGLRSTEST